MKLLGNVEDADADGETERIAARTSADARRAIAQI
jgi:hypothetical protein